MASLLKSRKRIVKDVTHLCPCRTEITLADDLYGHDVVVQKRNPPPGDPCYSVWFNARSIILNVNEDDDCQHVDIFDNDGNKIMHLRRLKQDGYELRNETLFLRFQEHEITISKILLGEVLQEAQDIYDKQIKTFD